MKRFVLEEVFFMKTKTAKLIINKIRPAVKAMVAVLAAAAVFWAAGPATARLDELLVDNASYVTPPAVTVASVQSLYEVKTGDTLWDISRKHGVSAETLAVANGLSDRDDIKAGQVLKVFSDCTLHRVQPGETLWDIARMYSVDINDIASRNELTDINNIIEGQKFFIPSGGKSIEPPSRGLAQWQLSWPLVGKVTSAFGMRDGKSHEGIDIAAEVGTPIRPVAPGRVVFAGSRGTYGQAVIVDHGGGMRTLYAHCSKVLVSEGDSVGLNTVIALAGNTGRSRGPHLHLEVLKDGIPLDPLECLEQESYYG